MTYPLLKNAPAQDSPEFLDYLRANNPVIYDGDGWLIIENCKYHTKEKPWYTAFWKGCHCGCIHQKMIEAHIEWYEDIDILWYEFGDWKWIKKSIEEQTIPRRFHIHLTK